MKPSKYPDREIKLGDVFFDIICEGIPDGLVNNQLIDSIVEHLIKEVREHMDAQYDRFKENTLT